MKKILISTVVIFATASVAFATNSSQLPGVMQNLNQRLNLIKENKSQTKTISDLKQMHEKRMGQMADILEKKAAALDLLKTTYEKMLGNYRKQNELERSKYNESFSKLSDEYNQQLTSIRESTREEMNKEREDFNNQLEARDAIYQNSIEKLKKQNETDRAQFNSEIEALKEQNSADRERYNNQVAALDQQYSKAKKNLASQYSKIRSEYVKTLKKTKKVKSSLPTIDKTGNTNDQVSFFKRITQWL